MSGAPITLTGTLVEGKVTSGPGTMPIGAGPLAGFKLYCVTFGSPPAAVTGTSDTAGKVTVKIDAKDVGFGCFILDSMDKGVASVVFKAGSSAGYTAKLGGDTDLGTITVDLSNGMAEVTLSSGTVTKTPAGVECPLGVWTIDTGPAKSPPCAAGTRQRAVIWVSKIPGGEYRASITTGPDDSGTGCAYKSSSSLSGTFMGGTLRLSFGEASCPTKKIMIELKPDASCTSAAVTATVEGAMTCGMGAAGCGAMNCPPVVFPTAMRE